MNGRYKFYRRRHPDARVYRLGLIAAIVLMTVLLQPQTVYPDQHREQVASRQVRLGRVLVVTATAYAYTGHHTFTGTWPQRGTVAVDPRVIPLGSRIWVEGYGMAVAEDTGGAIRGNRVDVYLESEVACRQYGRRQTVVRVMN